MVLITPPRAKVKPYFCPLKNASIRWQSQTIRGDKDWKDRESCRRDRLFAFGLHRRRLDDVLLGLVVPRIARVRDHRRDVDVREMRPRRHLAARRGLLHD